MTTVPFSWWRGLNPESHTWDTVGELAPHWGTNSAPHCFKLVLCGNWGWEASWCGLENHVYGDLYFTNQFSLSQYGEHEQTRAERSSTSPHLDGKLCIGCLFPNSDCRGSAISFTAFMKARLIEITLNAHPTSALWPQRHLLFRNSLTSSLLGF